MLNLFSCQNKSEIEFWKSKNRSRVKSISKKLAKINSPVNREQQKIQFQFEVYIDRDPQE